MMTGLNEVNGNGEGGIASESSEGELMVRN